MKNIKRKLKPLKRKIHFPNDEIWTYRITLSKTMIRNPNCEQFVIDSYIMAGYSRVDYYERDVFRNQSVRITPSRIKNYISVHLKQ